VAYKSTKQAQAEFLETQKQNRERNRSVAQRRKEKERWRGAVLFAVFVIVFAWYLSSHHR